MSLTAKFSRSYLSKASGERRAIYTVNGPTKELEAYKAFQGSYGVDKEGNAIIFADAPINRSQVYNIVFSEEIDRYYVDFSNLNDANATVATAKKRLTADLAQEIIRMEAVDLRGNSTRTMLSQESAKSETAEAASESADFEKEIEESAETSEETSETSED
jgi:hypothetical protein